MVKKAKKHVSGRRRFAGHDDAASGIPSTPRVMYAVQEWYLDGRPLPGVMVFPTFGEADAWAKEVAEINSSDIVATVAAIASPIPREATFAVELLTANGERESLQAFISERNADAYLRGFNATSDLTGNRAVKLQLSPIPTLAQGSNT